MTYDAEVLADSPLVYLILDESSGTAMADSSGNGRTATKAGSPAMHQAKVMPAGTFSIELNTVGEFVSIADASWMDATSFTVEAWVKCATVSSLHSIINRDGNAGARGWAFYVADGVISFRVNTGAGPNLTGTAAISANTGYHVVATYDGTTLRLYVNGVADGSVASAITTNLANALRIGTSLAGSGSQSFSLNGNIERAAMYGSALTAARVLAHYQAGISTFVGDVTRSLTISAASAARLGIGGSATPAVAITASSAGTRGKVGVAARTVAISTSSAARLGVSGRATPNLAVATSSAGVRGKIAAAAASVAIAAVSAGVVTSGATGDATPHLTISAASAAALGVHGQASPTLAVGTSSAGARGKVGAASRPLTVAAASAGVRGRPGAATPAFALSVVADGTVTSGVGSAIKFADGTTLINPRFADGTTLIVRGWLDPDGLTIHPFA